MHTMMSLMRITLKGRSLALTVRVHYFGSELRWYHAKASLYKDVFLF
jgi:hypothetical protein